ncbi:NADH-quinone oxidoreductase subunit L, partial [Verrucomicrobiota bacterium]
VLPRQMDRLRGLVAVAASVVTLFLAWPLFTAVRALDPGNALVYGEHLRLDHLGSFVLLAISFFGVMVAIYSMGYMAGKERLREYYAWLLWSVGFSCGAVLANDLLLFLVLWGVLGIGLYILTGIETGESSTAAKKTFIIVGGSDCLLMLGIAIVWRLTRTTQMDLISLPLDRTLSTVAVLCFLAAALAKAGGIPFHTWVPDCGEKAPASVAAFLPASLDKLLGIYLFARITRDLFQMDFAMMNVVMLLGAGTVICAVMMALVQHDLKRLLSYHAVSQVGYMILGIGTGTLVGVAGGLFHMLNHAIYKCALFLCAGSVERKAGTTDLDKLGGLAKTMPITFFTFVVAAMSISGIPPLNGFASKWMVYQGIVEHGRGGGYLWVIWLVCAMLGSALTLASFVKVLHAAFLRKPAPDIARKKVSEVGMSMWAPGLVLAALCILFGVAAHGLPLRGMILPAVGQTGDVDYPGVWRAGPATLMLISAYVLGLLVYFFSTARTARECPTYIGGEVLEEVRISGEEKGAGRDVEVTGVDFYSTIENLPPFRDAYAAARRKLFDIYDVGTGIIFYFVEALRKAHSGLLPLYLTWLLAGLVLVLGVLRYGMGGL